jgi:colanic acid biosynthesis glycosyl transferase WcaI
LTLVFPPDSVSTAILLGDLAADLRKLGHEITVVTTTPHYNLDPESLEAQPLSRCWSSQLLQSSFKGIPVLHTKIPRKGTRIGARLSGYMRFHAIGTLASLFLPSRYDMVLAPSPPLTVGVSAWLLGGLRRIPFVYNVQEIYPDVAVSLGVLRNKVIIRALSGLERFIYGRARMVVVISEWFRRRLIEKDVPPEKLRVISNFVDTEFIEPCSRVNDFSKRHGLDHKFVVLYAGNIGLTQNFENILSTARRLRHLPDLGILIVGDGAKRSWLEAEVSRGDHSNVKVLPYQHRSVVPLIYGSSDVCLVPLKKGTAHGTFPSKIYTIMAAGRGVITAADEDSELTWVTKESGCGWAIPPDDEIALARAIEQAYHERSRLMEMGQRGRAYVLQNHSRSAITRQYDAVIRETVLGKRPGQGM